MKPPVLVLAALALLGALLLCAQRWGYQAGRLDCGVQLAAPSLPVVPPRGIFTQAQALLARDKLQGPYARQLEALLEACRQGAAFW